MQNGYTASIIKQGLDYVVIGTKRMTGFGHRGVLLNEHVPKVVEAMNGVRALRAEVLSKDPTVLNENYPAMSIEQLTIASVKPEDWQPLAFTTKKGQYWSDVVQPYGIPIEVFEMVFLMQSLVMTDSALEQLLQNPDGFIAKYETPSSEAIRNMQGLAHHGELDYRRWVKNISENSELLFSKLSGMPVATLLFYQMSFIREYEIWKPDVEKMRSDYPNEKVAVMCGGRHVDFFVDLLEGKPVAKPHIEALRLAVSDAERPLLDEMLNSFK